MQRINFLLLSLFLLLFSACNTQETVDLIVSAKKIYTLDSNMQTVEAMAINEGKILMTGTLEDLKQHYTAKQFLTYPNSYIYPGFIDAHCHFLGYGIIQSQYANLKETTSFEEVVNRLKDYDLEHPERTWLLGRGWDQNDWENKQFPHKKIIDSLWPNKPVCLIRIDGHAVLANQKALDMAGFDIHTEIHGGALLSQNQQLTGILLDEAADSIKALIPLRSQQELEEALDLAQRNCFKVGLTSVVDAGMSKRNIDFLIQAEKSDQVKMNIYIMLSSSEENKNAFLLKGPLQTDHLHIRSVKLYADGALGSRGACLLHPYSDDVHNYGLIITDSAKIKAWGRLALEHGYQINTHAIGDSANRMVLQSYAALLKDKNDKRWRIEHAQTVHPDDLHYFQDFSIIPAVNTSHATSDMYWADERLGERIKYAYAYQDLYQQNDWLTNGSDFPIEGINPLLGFYAAVARQDMNAWPVQGFQKENALSREQALKSMTIWAAKGSFEEDMKGSIEKGKFADFVALDTDLMRDSIYQIPGAKVKATWVKGELVFDEAQEK
jgi:predicted amidohydrolase YtcJ